MERSEEEYKKEYREMELIGRGNFGSATLVQLNSDPRKHYIAKKIVLESLKEKEQEAALLEASVLKDLKHPNIVAYIDSFIINGVLVIIMEYCEEGDLSYHVKRKKQKEEHLPEKLILNWFLQLCLALKAIHEKKILHRDIKTSNIFVTSNGTVKIGDFGISKVLENTADQAQTVVGTPYYMSPEVCESKPYTYKSDIWALGCVLYELCTLKHAFDSNSLLGLVYKIVQEKVEAIPNIYSKELQSLVSKMLTKNDSKRPSIMDIFNDVFIQKTMTDFVENNGKIQENSKIAIKGTKTHGQMKKIMQQENVVNSNSKNQDDNGGYTDEMDKTVYSTLENTQVQGQGYNEDMDQTLKSNFEQTQQQQNQPMSEQELLGDTVCSVQQSQLPAHLQKQQLEQSQNYDKTFQTLEMNTIDFNKFNQSQGQQSQNFDMTGLTAKERMRLRKEQKVLEEQQRLMAATQQSVQNQNQAKQRKNNDLLSSNHFDMEKHQQELKQQHSQYYQQQQSQIQHKMAGTSLNYQQYQEFKQSQLQQQQQNNNNNNSFMDNTVYSVNEQTIRQVPNQQQQYKEYLSQTMAQKQREQDQKNNTLNTDLMNQFTQLQSSSGFDVNRQYQNNENISKFEKTQFDIDAKKDMQEVTSAFEKTNFQENEMDVREITAFQSIPAQNLEVKSEDEEYEDDFEEYNDSDEEEEVQDNTRLTVKANAQDLQSVVNLYKDTLEGTLHNKKASMNTVTPLQDIKETTLEYKPMTPQQPPNRKNSVTVQEERIMRMRKECIAKVGEDKFVEIYDYMKSERVKDTPDEQLYKQMKDCFGKNTHTFQKIDEILFLEAFQK